ncbi:MAG: hypothetical protein CBC09_00745 [Cellvibrionales bacterium TMED49]|nr:hypothetical protein [Porticoccaceae bacterium]OUU40202.1 MAG: hypothetical protein CBC09_00745 [Cellvibrionales bacterium TMED49]
MLVQEAKLRYSYCPALRYHNLFLKRPFELVRRAFKLEKNIRWFGFIFGINLIGKIQENSGSLLISLLEHRLRNDHRMSFDSSRLIIREKYSWRS